tara:strand:+ start:5159 stop:5848 length:690 start_codon:yes stop_codon:yes gene_type:complete
VQKLIGIIGGTGKEGVGIASRLVQSGENVCIGSRDPNKSEMISRKLRKINPNLIIQSATNLETAKISDLLFLTINPNGIEQLISDIKPYLDNKIIVDTTVPLKYSNGKFSHIEWPNGSSSLHIQALIPSAKVVSGFHTISAKDLNNLKQKLNQDVFLASNDRVAKTKIFKIVNKIPNLRAIDCGNLDVSKYLESCTLLLLNINQIYSKKNKNTTHTGLKLSGLSKTENL